MNFDFDAAIADAEQTFERRARILTEQDRVVAELQYQLAQAERAWDEANREFEQAATELDDLMTYTGTRYDYPANETRYAEWD